MARYTSEQRQQYADTICDLVREWIGDHANDFDLEVRRGVEWRPELNGDARHPRANNGITMTLVINGGAQESEGAPIVAAPRVFRDE